MRNKKYAPEGNEHPVFYWEDLASGVIHFYKPISSVLYCCEVMKMGLPENITIDGLKSEFSAIELPKQPDAPKSITGTIYG